MKYIIKKYGFWLFIFPLLLVLFSNAGKSYEKPIDVFIQKKYQTEYIREYIEAQEVVKKLKVHVAGDYEIEQKVFLAEIHAHQEKEEEVTLVFQKDNMLSFFLFDDYVKKEVDKSKTVYGITAINWFQKYLLSGFLIIFLGTLSKLLYFWIYQKTKKHKKSFLLSFMVSLILFYMYTGLAQILGVLQMKQNFVVASGTMLLFILVNLCITRLMFFKTKSKEKRLQKIMVMILPDILLSNLILPLDNMTVLAQYIAKIVPSSYISELWITSMVKSEQVTLTCMLNFIVLVAIYAMLIASAISIRNLKAKTRKISYSKT
ncbi:hypothetical protein [Aquimarina rhabdastrellae]